MLSINQFLKTSNEPKKDINYDSYEGLKNKISKLNYKFLDFTLTNEGDYDPKDVDYNYKDIPHLNIVHSNVRSVATLISHDFYCAVNSQKLFGITFPMTLVNYSSTDNSQTYFTTFAFFIFIIHTEWKKIGKNTIVETKYSIGCTPLLFFLTPLIKFSLKKNYKILMSEDIPMRNQRNKLRKAGYDFLSTQKNKCSYLETTNVSNDNLVMKSNPEKISIDLKRTFEGKNQELIGDIGLMGFKILKKNEKYSLFSRVCPHEGADLSETDFFQKDIKCPWHGRRIFPLIEFALEDNFEKEIKDYVVTKKENNLQIHIKNNLIKDSSV